MTHSHSHTHTHTHTHLTHSQTHIPHTLTSLRVCLSVNYHLLCHVRPVSWEVDLPGKRGGERRGEESECCLSKIKLPHLIGSDVAPIGMVFKYDISSCSKSSVKQTRKSHDNYGKSHDQGRRCHTQWFNGPFFRIPVLQYICVSDSQLDWFTARQGTLLWWKWRSHDSMDHTVLRHWCHNIVYSKFSISKLPHNWESKYHILTNQRMCVRPINGPWL